MTDEQPTVRNILITGGASSTGLRLIRLLNDTGHKVAATATNSKTAAQVRANGGLPVYCDMTRMGEVRSMLAMAEADMVIHLAPQYANQIPFMDSRFSPEMVTASTEALVQAAQQTGVAYIVHLSYAFIYGNTGSQEINEQTMPGSESESALVQAAQHAETMVKNSGISYTILRAGYVYDANSEVMQAVADTLRGGRPLPMGEGGNYANWVHADDLAQAIALTVEKQPAGEIINVVDDTPVTPRQFLTDFGTALGVRPGGSLPGFLTRMRSGKTVTELLHLSVRASNAKAKDVLGWEPRFGAHSAGLEDVLLTWRARTPVN